MLLGLNLYSVLTAGDVCPGVVLPGAFVHLFNTNIISQVNYYLMFFVGFPSLSTADQTFSCLWPSFTSVEASLKSLLGFSFPTVASRVQNLC